VKKWIESNKIWFETVAASLLSLMAVIVSISQERTASRQTELLTIQTKIAEAQASPQFEVEMQKKRDDVSGKFDDYTLVVNNRGGIVEGFDAQAAVFLHLVASGNGLETLKADIPISGYFASSFPSAAGTGQLVSMVGDHNNAAVIKLSDDLRETKGHERLGFVRLSEEIVVRLRYRDLLGRRGEVYYEARFVGGGLRVSDDIGRARLVEWEGAIRPELSKVSAEELLVAARHGR
jgi:hypothetical protein